MGWERKKDVLLYAMREPMILNSLIDSQPHPSHLPLPVVEVEIGIGMGISGPKK